MAKLSKKDLPKAAKLFIDKRNMPFFLCGKHCSIKTPWGEFEALGRVSLGFERVVMLHLQGGWGLLERRLALAHMLVGPLSEDRLVFLDDNGEEGLNELSCWSEPGKLRNFQLVMYLQYHELQLDRGKSEIRRLPVKLIYSLINRALGIKKFDKHSSWGNMDDLMAKICTPEHLFTHEAIVAVLSQYVGESLNFANKLEYVPTALPTYILRAEGGHWVLEVGRMVQDVLHDSTLIGGFNGLSEMYDLMCREPGRNLLLPFADWFTWRGDTQALEDGSPCLDMPVFTAAEHLRLGEAQAELRLGKTEATLRILDEDDSDLTSEHTLPLRGTPPYYFKNKRTKESLSDSLPVLKQRKTWAGILGLEMAQRLRLAHLRACLNSERDLLSHNLEQVVGTWRCTRCYCLVTKTLRWGKGGPFRASVWRRYLLETMQDYAYGHCHYCGSVLQGQDLLALLGSWYSPAEHRDLQWCRRVVEAPGWCECFGWQEYADNQVDSLVNSVWYDDVFSEDSFADLFGHNSSLAVDLETKLAKLQSGLGTSEEEAPWRPGVVALHNQSFPLEEGAEIKFDPCPGARLEAAEGDGAAKNPFLTVVPQPSFALRGWPEIGLRLDLTSFAAQVRQRLENEGVWEGELRWDSSLVESRSVQRAAAKKAGDKKSGKATGKTAGKAKGTETGKAKGKHLDKGASKRSGCVGEATTFTRLVWSGADFYADLEVEDLVQRGVDHEMFPNEIIALAALYLRQRAQRVRAILAAGEKLTERWNCALDAVAGTVECRFVRAGAEEVRRFEVRSWYGGEDTPEQRAAWLLRGTPQWGRCACGCPAYVVDRIAPERYWRDLDGELVKRGFASDLQLGAVKLMRGFALRCPYHVTELSAQQWEALGKQAPDLMRQCSENRTRFRAKYAVWETQDDKGLWLAFIGGHEAGGLVARTDRLAGVMTAAGIVLPENHLFWAVSPNLLAVSAATGATYSFQLQEEEFWSRYWELEPDKERWEFSHSASLPKPQGPVQVVKL